MTGIDYLYFMKEKPFLAEIVYGQYVDEVVDFATAWAMCGSAIDPNILKNNLPEDDRDAFCALWASVTFDPKKLQRSSRRLINETLFRKMVEAHIIYPDGTYNSIALNALIRMEKMANA